MKTFTKWFVEGSTDPTQVSKSFTGLLVANIGIIMWALHYFNLNYSVEQVTNGIGQIGIFVGSAIFVVGFLRKIYYLFKKKN